MPRLLRLVAPRGFRPKSERGWESYGVLAYVLTIQIPLKPSKPQ
ncbi:MAG: hypothetical protein QXK12_01885 [Candidatus Nezhaarchaeales archaeon]